MNKEELNDKKAEEIRKEIKKLEVQGKKICKKEGHSKMFYSFWGYVYCARCGEQIGDKLGSCFFGADKMIGVECQDKPCKICDPIIKKLNPFDKKMLKLHRELNKLGYAV